MKNGDRLVVIIVCTVIIAAFAITHMINNKTDYKTGFVVIRHEGKVIKKLSVDQLKEFGQLVITSRYNNVITWQDGSIRFESSDCPNHVCVKTGWVSSPGQMAVCAPNHVTISFKTNNINNIDGVSY